MKLGFRSMDGSFLMLLSAFDTSNSTILVLYTIIVMKNNELCTLRADGQGFRRSGVPINTKNAGSAQLVL